MSISFDTSMLNMNQTITNNNGDKVTNTLKNLSSTTTEDELMKTCKDFQSYFIEEVLKEVKENMTLEEEDEDSSLSTLTDYHMDGVVELISDQILEQSGNSLTQQLYEQMKRNYGIDAVTNVKEVE